MRKCALATERRMFVPPPTGWQVADIFVSVPRVHQFQLVLKRSGSPQKPSSRPYSGALPGLRSNAQMGLQHAWIGPVLESRAPRRRSGSTLYAAGRAAAVTIVPTAIQNLTAPSRNGGRDRQLY